MEQRPPQPPEGKLIADAASRLSLSIREAARRAGISYGRWRQITSGYQNVSPGNVAAVRAPAKTLAKMAAVVGVTPEQMEAEGQRPDAAQEMREMRQEPPWAHLTPVPKQEHVSALPEDIIRHADLYRPYVPGIMRDQVQGNLTEWEADVLGNEVLSLRDRWDMAAWQRWVRDGQPGLEAGAETRLTVLASTGTGPPSLHVSPVCRDVPEP